jgi:glycosyltransferase involved in cell wall biosynthesis
VRKGQQSLVVAINDQDAEYAYARRVIFQIDQSDPHSYVEAARYLNRSRVQVVSLQHEFGLYGGLTDGEVAADNFLPLLRELKKPVVTTLHTVLPQPSESLKSTIAEIYELSAATVVMVNMAALILAEDYGLAENKADQPFIPPRKLHVIPHGVPQVEMPRRSYNFKRALREEHLVATFGLISSGKGLEYVVEAMPQVIAQHPNTAYLILGATHPEVRRREGERYREYLMELARTHGVQKHVRFNNRYLPQSELVAHLKAIDIYITPYLNRHQITSGTLAYALGAGKAIISTPYLYAQEALAEGRGLLAEFRSPDSIANCINQILGTPGLQEHMQEQAYAYGREMSWTRVAERYDALIREIAC